MLSRELTIALRSPLTWVQAALSALLVGHGFVLAIDLYSAGSRSVEGNVLMAREFDPLLGIVRPTLGGLYLAISLLGVVAAVRPLAIEKERRTLEPLLLSSSAPVRVVVSMFVAAAAAIALQLAAPIVLLGSWRAAGGHLAIAETVVALVAYVLYLLLIAAVAVASAAWSAALAQAATFGILIVALSWAIDAAEGFAALAWLGRAVDWSTTTHLQPMERGTVALGAIVWMLMATAAAVAVAVVGIRYDLRPTRRLTAVVLVLGVGVGGLMVANRWTRSIDATELHRRSLPPDVVTTLRSIREPLGLDVYLDRDDARRRQLEVDALARLRLARPDLEVRNPLDARDVALAGDRDDSYGRIVVRVGDTTRSTYSTSRRELATMIFEMSGTAEPSWSQTEYPGHPLVIDGGRRRALIVLAYLVLPAALGAAGWILTRTERTAV